MNEFCMLSVLILWPNQLMIIPALRWQLFLSKNLEWEMFTYISYTLREPITCQCETRPALQMAKPPTIRRKCVGSEI